MLQDEETRGSGCGRGRFQLEDQVAGGHFSAGEQWRNKECHIGKTLRQNKSKISYEENMETVGTRVIRNEEKVFVDMINCGNVVV